MMATAMIDHESHMQGPPSRSPRRSKSPVVGWAKRSVPIINRPSNDIACQPGESSSVIQRAFLMTPAAAFLGDPPLAPHPAGIGAPPRPRRVPAATPIGQVEKRNPAFSRRIEPLAYNPPTPAIRPFTWFLHPSFITPLLNTVPRHRKDHHILWPFPNLERIRIPFYATLIFKEIRTEPSA